MASAIRVILLALATVLFTACADRSIKPGGPDDSNIDQASPEYINQLLAEAEQTDNPSERLSIQLTAAEILARGGNTDWARSIMSNLPAQVHPELNESIDVTARRALVQSYIFDADGYSPLAYDNLNNNKINEILPILPPELQIPILELRAKVLLNMDLLSSSIEERIKLGQLLPGDSLESEINQDRIWLSLMDIPKDALSNLRKSAPDRELKGWYTLAELSKSNQTNLREQLQQVEQWMLDWPEHPASMRPPADLQILQQLLDQQAQTIAVLLPTTGKLSSAVSAILDGFMAAHYELKNKGEQVPTLRFYDTNSADVQLLYEQAQFDGAELVIGPLEKENIVKLMELGHLPIPVLALNTIDSNVYPPANLYQFGLGVEDEAEQAAVKAWRDGHRRALIITPNTFWGDRATDAFKFTWIGLGGELTYDYRFEDNNDYSKVISKALQLDESHVRSREMYSIVGHIEFEPRRRQDIDMIFLAAQAKQARQVKPTLAFHYAGDIPVYGTSHIYSGKPNTKLDQDMDGTRFSTLPWFFDQQSNEKKAIKRFANNSANLQPLYALGVDSFHLYPRLKQLETIKQAHFYGKTGQLRLDEQRVIRRKQVWARFSRGVAKLLN